VSQLTSILIVDDEKHSREGLRKALEGNYDVYIAEDAAAAYQLLETQNFDVLITDLRLPGDDGMKIIQRALTQPHPPICLMMTAYGSVETAVEAMRKGAYDYLTKPIDLDRLDILIKRALRSRSVEAENKNLKQRLGERSGFENIIGESPVMKQVFETIEQVAPTRATVLIEGESGTGKELIAHAIHELSPRKNAPFVAVHCAALTPTLLESELFGHEKGAFTGALERRVGRFEAADGGTIFLDEIGEVDASVQVKILRVLGERSFERVGGSKTMQVDVRVIAATNKNLAQCVEQGKFREDLYYRLKVVEIRLPPLCERREDIPLMVREFLKEFSLENKKQVEDVAGDAQAVLMAYDWPGNVRELRSAIELAVIWSKDGRVTLQNLPPILRDAATKPGAQALPTGMNLEQTEKAMMARALENSGGNVSRAAAHLGISRRTLHRKIKKFGLKSSRH
jgi:DNA-binding NtrC family response regulator